MSAEPSILLSIIEAFIHPREALARPSPAGRPVHTDGLVSLPCLNKAPSALSIGLAEPRRAGARLWPHGPHWLPMCHMPLTFRLFLIILPADCTFRSRLARFAMHSLPP